jgi:diguanylate cyclase (GGDEF)-like protein
MALQPGSSFPPTPSWAGDVVNYDVFIRATGVPIQLVRGLLACFTAFSVWAYWGQRLIVNIASARYEKFQHRQFFWTLAAMGGILVVGWVLTDYLGGSYKRNVEAEAAGDLNLIASRLSVETSAIRGSVKALATTRSIAAMAAHDGAVDAKRAQEDLQLQAGAAGATGGYILDATGKVIAVTGPAPERSPRTFDEPHLQITPAGNAVHIAIDGASHMPTFYAAQQIVSTGGEAVGIAVLTQSLSDFAADVQAFDRSFALIDRNGVVLLSNRAEMQFRALWPLAADKQSVLAKRYGRLNNKPLLAQELVHSTWIMFNDERDYVQRKSILTGDWSLVMWMATDGISANRVLGIIITLQMTMLALVYLIGKERWIHDNIQLERRLELEERARNLDTRATTDPLTGLYNRRKFDRSIATEILRVQRYGTPLSLIIYDVDHFKNINDTAGHQAGDNVLIKLTRFVAARVRDSDIQARWGGEEFVILCPGSTMPMASQLAGNLRDTIRTLAFDHARTVTCSFGVAQYVDGDTAESLLARADDALYQAKMNGRDRVEQAPPPPAAAPSLQPVE